jgi:hypothetical protein
MKRASSTLTFARWSLSWSLCTINSKAEKGGPDDFVVYLIRPFFEEPTYLTNLNVEIKFTFQKFLSGPSPVSPSLPSDPLQPFLGFVVMREAALVSAKGASVIIAATVD